MDRYYWNYVTPEGFTDLTMFSDGRFLTGLVFEKSADGFRNRWDKWKGRMLDGTLPNGESRMLDGLLPGGESSMPDGPLPDGESRMPDGPLPDRKSWMLDGLLPGGESSMPDGTLPDGGSSMLDGSLPDGGSWMSDGSLPDGGGWMSDGSLPDGESSMPDGPLLDGGSSILDGPLPDCESRMPDGPLPDGGCWIENQDSVLIHKLLPVFEDTILWLDQYFGKDPKTGEFIAKRSQPDFAPAIKIEGLTPFRRKVLTTLTTVPFGQTVTYGEIARVIGKEKMSARAVGGAVGWNPICIIIPCHRVLGANGAITGYGGGINNKMALLKWEGIML